MISFRKSSGSLFATESLAGHLLRGAAAVALGAGAVAQQGAHPVLAVAAAMGALVALRGCPVCWTVGLAETLARRRRGRRLPSS